MAFAGFLTFWHFLQIVDQVYLLINLAAVNGLCF
jgi:hypothetical protein